MKQKIIIRQCRPEECSLILDLWHQAGSTPSVSDTAKDLAKLLEKDRELILVAECDGGIIGTVMGGWDGWRGNIYRLAVLPDRRRHGIGKMLVREIERRLASRGVRKISILVEKDEEPATAFWKSMRNDSYEQDDRITRYAKSL